MVAERLRAARIDAIAHRDHLQRADLRDVEWLPEVGNNGWLLLTEDLHIARRPAELEALGQYQIGCFLIPQLRVEAMAPLVLQAWTRISNIARDRQVPYIYKIQLNANVVRRDTPEFVKRWKKRAQIN